MALSHLLQQRSCRQICTIRFHSVRRRCKLSVCSDGENDNPLELKKEAVVEETSVVAAESFVKESSKKLSNLFPSNVNELADRVSKKITTLSDVFREHKHYQMAPTPENKETTTEGELSGVLLNFVKSKQFEYRSHSDDSNDGHLKKFPPDRCKNGLLDSQNVRHEEGRTNSPSESIQEGLDLEDCYEKSPDDEQAAREIVKPSSYQPLDHSNEPRSEDAENSFLIQGLVDFLRLQSDAPSNSTNNTGLIKDNTSNGNSWIGDGETRTLDFNSGDRPDLNGSMEVSVSPSNKGQKKLKKTDLNASMEVSVSPSNKGQKKLKKTRLAGKISEENKVLVRFLPTSFADSHISQCFGSCGYISKIEFPYAEGQPLFKGAYISFKTREGFEEAIKKSGLAMNNRILTVESANSSEKTVRSPIPSLIGDPEVPAALVKNPTRTIKIEKLTRDINSHHIEEALAFCESRVTGYFLGSSHSVAYVEFETEIGKEMALAKQSIDVLGRHLAMLRIDSPRTTVVRISSVEPMHICSICRSLGEVKFVLPRSRCIQDVYFGISEWPNMWKILNGLNGAKVEEIRLQAEPAPVFPSEVLLALWHQPEGRKHLKAAARNLIGKIVGHENEDISAFTSLQNVFLDEI